MPEIDLGVITEWSGSIAGIPPGWFLCDGTEGTPDLRDRFVPAAGSTFAVNDTGGAVNHDHDFISDGHFHELVSGPDINTPSGGPKRNILSEETISGTTNNASILPTFYALAYIQFNGV